ncbi:MAG: hypothetical protein OEY01_09500 [Desulfobulbaceae bacterium]|nr:hypothetical protein [Desulfobulbaceae bacterium]HIJ79238.1 hypothetical protein [Deltaproteobacteria bacterium]
MAATKKHDIMDDLLNGGTEADYNEIAELNKLIHQEILKAKSARAKNSTADTTKKKKAGRKDSKRKTTHYLSEEIFADLDEAREKINTLMQKKLKSRVSKSKIVDHALKMILKDFEEKGKESPIIQEMLKDIFKE